VGYRVQEQLASIGGNTAVGRTGAVTGTFTLDGTSVTAASFTATLSGLTSDDRGRDGRVQDALNTRQFPTTTFVLSSPIALGSIPADGQEITATAKGKLTIRGVTKEVEFQLTARLSGGALVVKASTQFAFADFSIPKPQSFLVLSIADTGTIEAQLTLARS
jgi:polyisoprenoid-binding protein YceI